MRLKHVFGFASGLGVFAISIVLIILAVNNPYPLFVAIICISVTVLAPIGFELCRFAFCPADKEYRFFSRGHRGYIFDMVIMLLAFCLTVATVSFQHSSDPLCYGRLSAGFPLAFICDASGESPLSSVGQIDWADLDSINILGSFIDILFFITLLWIARLSIHRFSYFVDRHPKFQ